MLSLITFICHSELYRFSIGDVEINLHKIRDIAAETEYASIAWLLPSYLKHVKNIEELLLPSVHEGHFQ